MLTGRSFSWQALRQVMERVNAQMDVMSEARDLIAAARPCPVTLRDQVSAYQTNWHRGTLAGPGAGARLPRRGPRQRVADGVGGVRHTRGCGCCTGACSQEPDFHAYLEERYGAVFVGAPYGAMPQTYARTVYDDDPLRALSARQIFLFDMTSTSWMLSEAQRYGVDAVVGVEDPSPLSVPLPPGVRGCRDCATWRCRASSDDPEVRGILDGFFSERHDHYRQRPAPATRAPHGPGHDHRPGRPVRDDAAGGARRARDPRRESGRRTARRRRRFSGRTVPAWSRTAPDDLSMADLTRHRNKLGITLNLKQPGARDVLHDLVAHSDVVVDNFSRGTLDKLGFDFHVHARGQSAHRVGVA